MTQNDSVYEEENLLPEGEPARTKPTVEATLAALQMHEGDILPSTLYYGLSGLGTAEIEQVKPVWDRLSADFRANLLNQLTESSESNFEFDYKELGWLALNDGDGLVREEAINLLWEDETIGFMSRLIEMSQYDESDNVRAAAVSALGRFILLGEYEEISEADATRAQEAAINLLTDANEELNVRRRALEAISNSSHEIVAEAIEEAYNSGEHLMQVSSIFAMGRSYDAQWNETVLKELKNNDPEMRYEAARAAGELEIEESVRDLGLIAVNDELEVKTVAIWSLGEIGGREALRILTALAEDAEEAENDELIEAIEDAIGSASLTEGGFDIDDELDD